MLKCEDLIIPPVLQETMALSVALTDWILSHLHEITSDHSDAVL
jgi:hypothetical protein